MIRFSTEQVTHENSWRPVRGMSRLLIWEETALREIATYAIYHLRGEPILIQKRKTTFLQPAFRLASDGASAIQMRRLRDMLRSSFDRVPQLPAQDMNSKVNEIIASVVSNTINHLLTGE